MSDILIKKGDVWTPYESENVIVNFTSDKIRARVDDPVYFYDITYPKPSYWIWKFGDGFESELENPIHEYKQEGFYSVTLMVSYDSGSKFIVKKNYIEITNDIEPEPEPGPTYSTTD
jgi:PKD repeat protein